MKLTKERLKQIIKEELKLVQEGFFGFGGEEDPGIPHPVDDMITKLQQSWDTHRDNMSEEQAAVLEKAITDAIFSIPMLSSSGPESELPQRGHLRRIKE
tara:strand:+ start:1622 stop:1918 length:297 start_codon:yes stop_codon:yes gene_type:complete